MSTVAAWTAMGVSYPEYFNATVDGDEVRITIRAAPEVRENSSFVCGFKHQKGQPGRCTPGDARCNNYCNMAPEKGPMQPHPATCTQVICGETVSMRMPADQFRKLCATILNDGDN